MAPFSRSLAEIGWLDNVRLMRNLLVLAIHLFVTFARLVRPSGVRAVAAESLLLKHQLVISNRFRQRAPNLNSLDPFVLGLLRECRPRRCRTDLLIARRQLGCAITGDKESPLN